MVYTECFGIQKVKDAGGSHVGYVAACGSGIEDNCGGIDTHLQAQCLADVRRSWRAVTIRSDLDGNIVWYTMDNFLTQGQTSTLRNDFINNY